MDKTINIRSIVYTEDVDKKDIVHMNCQIGSNVDTLNLSIFVTDKDSYEQNKELVREKCEEFIKAAFSEAVSAGWDMLK